MQPKRKVLNIAIDALFERENERAGGRIFVSKGSVIFKRDGRIRTLCTFSWQGEDPYQALLEYFHAL